MKAATPTKSAIRLKSPDTSRSDVEPGGKRSGSNAGKSTPTSARDGQPLVSERKKTGDKQGALLSPSNQPPKNRAYTPNQHRTGMQDSPYKPAAASPAASSVAPASAELASLRRYLQTLRPDNLANTIFRDQTSGTAGFFPVIWIKKVQDSQKDTARDLMKAILAAAPADKLIALLPPLDGDQAFEWSGFGKLCATLWQDFSSLALSGQSPTRLTRGLLVELADELQRIPAFLALDPEKRERVLADALFSVFIWNGILSPLMTAAPDTHKRLFNYFSIYIKVAHGISATTQGDSGQHIISLMKAAHTQECAAFQKKLMDEVTRVAQLRTVHVHDAHEDPRLNKRREGNMDRYFTETWLVRADDYVKQVRQGNYFLTGQDGLVQKCRSYNELRDYVGLGAKKQLPEVLLHVAGERITNFLCQTYLYDGDPCYFTDADGRKVDPVPALKTRFILSRSDSGVITVQYCCHDDAVASAMLELDGGDFEGIPLFPASITFNGKMRFHPNEDFECGKVNIQGLNFHLFE